MLAPLAAGIQPVTVSSGIQRVLRARWLKKQQYPPNQSLIQINQQVGVHFGFQLRREDWLRAAFLRHQSAVQESST